MRIDKKKNRLFNYLQLATVALHAEDWRMLDDLIRYGSAMTAQQEIGLLQNAILDIEWQLSENDLNPECEGMVLGIAIPAICHLLVACMDKGHQHKIWELKLRDDWESDGHYGHQTRDEFLTEQHERLFVSRKRLKQIADTLQSARQHELRYHLGAKEGPCTK